MMLSRTTKIFRKSLPAISDKDIEDLVFSAIESAIGGMIITDTSGVIIYVNKAFLSMFQYNSKRDIIGNHFSELFKSKKIEETIDIHTMLEKGVTEFKVIRKPGDIFYVTLTSSEISDSKGRILGVMLSLFDITKRKTAELELKKVSQQLLIANNELKKLATEDSLTGLANRRTFDAHIEGEWKRCKRERVPLSILMIDVDYFKRYNDNYGHRMGDSCLMELSSIMRQTRIASREGDLIARYGGEEFTIILSGTDQSSALKKAGELLSNVQKAAIPHLYSDVADTKVVTLSIGTATEERFEGSAEDLIREADAALYRAKRAGRNQVVAAQTR